MLRRTSKSRLNSATVLVALGALVSGCATTSVRAVVDVVPAGLSYAMETRSSESVGKPELATDALLETAVVEPTGAESTVGESLAAASAPEDFGFMGLQATLGSGRTQLDPELGPMDLGYPLLIDLGAGEAPYDDGVRTIHCVERTRSGFSDAVLQASWRESMSPSSMLHATVAVTRFQDLGMLEGADEMRFSWFVIGWKVSL